MHNSDLSVIIPVFNEERTIGIVIQSLLNYLQSPLEIIVVDDGSRDDTCVIVQKIIDDEPGSGVQLIQHESNKGKTAALQTGIKASNGDIVVIQDADLEYDPQDIPEIIAPIVSGKADVVYGSRFLVRKMSRVLYYKHYLVNKCLTNISNLFTDMNFTDVETGYKAFRGDLIRGLQFSSKRFGFEIEVTAKISKLGCRVFEVPISYSGRTYEEGKKIGFWDAIWAFYYVLRYNLFD
jgi:glycosyltransferase involved in cell wall biosynthesis